MRSERWNTESEIKRRLEESNKDSVGAGPILYVENGREFVDDGESHIAVVGRTGKGKSQCSSMPFVQNVINKRESAIIIDPKGEMYKNLSPSIPEEYKVMCIDFRFPRSSPTSWNPLAVPYRLFHSEHLDEQDASSQILSELWNSVYTEEGEQDKFWVNASANLCKGISYALFEHAEKDEVTLNNVASILEQSEQSSFGNNSLLHNLYKELPVDSLARRNLSAYVTAPPEGTRPSIHSVAVSRLEMFSQSQGLMEMLSEDSLDILNLDLDKPFYIFIIIPDETSVYDSLAGILISQISQHLIRVAQSRGGSLPVRVNIILEELGSVGKSIPALPNLMTAARSRNIRLMLVMQSNMQLEDVYGMSMAQVIDSCVGITIAYATNHWGTLLEWSQRCGEVYINNGVSSASLPLITPSQLAAMPAGTALVLLENQHKFITHLPFYFESRKAVTKHSLPKTKPRKRELEFFDLLSFIKRVKIKKARSKDKENENLCESLISEIDQRLAELEGGTN